MDQVTLGRRLWKKNLLGYMNISHKITYNIKNESYLNTLVQKLMDSKSSIK